MNNVYVRLITYVLSLIAGAIPAWAAGWLVITEVDGWIHVAIEIKGAVTAVGSALGLTAGVFRRWGVK